MSEALVKIDAHGEEITRPHPRLVIQQATEEANALAEVIESRKLFSIIQGKRFVKCEGWVTLACLRGCLPREVSVTEMPEGRYVAEVELVRVSDGFVLTKASAECGGPEDSVWQIRPSNARRSMAITRATGKACRVAFSWVMALAGFEPTPAEEMDFGANEGEDSRRDPAPRGQRQDSRQPAARGASPADDGIPVWVGKLVNVETKTARNGSTYYVFHGADGQRFATFSETISKGLQALDGKTVEIVYETTAKGNASITEYRSKS